MPWKWWLKRADQGIVPRMTRPYAIAVPSALALAAALTDIGTAMAKPNPPVNIDVYETPAPTAVPGTWPPVLLVIVAHPDDELVIAPALSALARKENVAVKMIHVTSGDAGPGVSGMEPGEELAKARKKEGRCASEALGLDELIYFGMGDGTLSDTPRAPDSPARKLTTRLTEEIDTIKPRAIITWGPDGGYGHGDHRMVGAIVTQILQEMPPETRPDLAYPALVHTPLPEPLIAQGWTTTAPDLANSKIAYDEVDLAAATKAAQCYKTQFDDATRAMIVPGFHQLVWKGEVSFREAF
ncbi:MAG: PIG-L family deacetylase [Pseudomonadota bacterium]